MCDCPRKGFAHWWEYTRLRYWIRWLRWNLDIIFVPFYIRFGRGPCMTRDEWEHWFGQKHTPQVVKDALIILERKQR